MKNNKNLKVAIVMGSQSDYKTMQLSAKILKKMGIKFETKIISAHRTPKRMYEFASSAVKNNIGVIIAGAGGSAHLPGMIAALSSIPVLGVPIESKKLKGLDSLLSIAQMPKGIPVGTLAIGKDGAVNAALLAASIKLRLGLPTVNLLTKTDLIADNLDQILNWSSNPMQLEESVGKDLDGETHSLTKDIIRSLNLGDFVDELIPISNVTEEGMVNLESAISRIINMGEEVED